MFWAAKALARLCLQIGKNFGEKYCRRNGRGRKKDSFRICVDATILAFNFKLKSFCFKNLIEAQVQTIKFTQHTRQAISHEVVFLTNT